MNSHRVTAASIALGVALLGGAIFDGHFKRPPAPEPVVVEQVIAREPEPAPVVQPEPAPAPRVQKAKERKVPAREQKRRQQGAKPVNVPAQEQPHVTGQGQGQRVNFTCSDVRQANATLSQEQKSALIAKATSRQRAFAASCLRGG